MNYNSVQDSLRSLPPGRVKSGSGGNNDKVASVDGGDGSLNWPRSSALAHFARLSAGRCGVVVRWFSDRDNEWMAVKTNAQTVLRSFIASRREIKRQI